MQALSYTQVLLSAIFGYFIFGEVLSLLSTVGAVVVLVGMVMSSLGKPQDAALPSSGASFCCFGHSEDWPEAACL